MQQAIAEAKKMLLTERENRDGTQYEERAYYDGKIDVLQSLIERLESLKDDHLPQEPTTDGLLEEMPDFLHITKINGEWDADVGNEEWVSGFEKPGEALLALKEKLPVEKLYKRIEEITGVKCFKTKGEEKEFYNKLHYNQ